MHVLGIETSCDETAAAVVTNGTAVASSVVSSSLAHHKHYGGIIPEIAFRKQLETITNVVDCCLKQAAMRLDDIDLISVTEKPGLAGSLLVGVSFAEALGFCADLPLVKVDHLHGHIYSGFLGRRGVRFPCAALVASGGHTSLYEVRDFCRIRLLGATADDACGEAFDKVARILGLGYPGGPVIERLARKGNPRAIRFSCSNAGKPLDFSFSGIKTAVLYFVQKNFKSSESRKVAKPANLRIEDVCASFQEAALGVLVEKSLRCCRMKRLKTIVVGGGVAANSRLRELFRQAADREKVEVVFPEKQWCTDNAAMVAGLGYWLYNKKTADIIRRRHA